MQAWKPQVKPDGRIGLEKPGRFFHSEEHLGMGQLKAVDGVKFY
jgi:hypothetical protein